MVGKDNDGDWLAISIESISRYERTGEISGSLTTSPRNKQDWAKAKLQPGQEDPSAGRVPVRGTSHVQRQEAQNNASAVKNFMRRISWEEAGVWTTRDWAQHSMPDVYLAKESYENPRKKEVFNMQSGRRMPTDMSNSELSRMRLVKLHLEDISMKSELRAGDHVLVTDHRTFTGKLMKVYRVTPAENRQPGVYLEVPDQRPLYISNMNTLRKVMGVIGNAARESLDVNESHIIRFDDFNF